MFVSRRHMLHAATCGFGSLALMQMQDHAHGSVATDSEGGKLLAPKPPHHPPRADSLIFLHMRGGPSAMETFERKPELDRRASEQGDKKGRMLTPSHWKWERRGESGLWASDLLKHTAKHADELCVLSGMHTDISNHTPAMLQLHTGSFTFTRPSMGSWLLYGLGTENQNLPGFISISPPVINGGSKNYGSAFLPAVYQGTAIGDIKTPVRDAATGQPHQPSAVQKRPTTAARFHEAVERRLRR